MGILDMENNINLLNAFHWFEVKLGEKINLTFSGIFQEINESFEFASKSILDKSQRLEEFMKNYWMDVLSQIELNNFDRKSKVKANMDGLNKRWKYEETIDRETTKTGKTSPEGINELFKGGFESRKRAMGIDIKEENIDLTRPEDLQTKDIHLNDTQWPTNDEKIQVSVSTSNISFSGKLASDLRCSKCDKSFASKQVLKVHIRSIHEKIKDYSCDYCDYTTADGSNFRRHINKYHKQK